MLTQTEPMQLGDWLVWEEDNRYSREEVTLLTGTAYVGGQVLGIVTASGKYAPHDQDGADGTEVAKAVLINAVDATSADQPGVAIRRLAQIKPTGLVWQADIEAGEITTALAELEVEGIQVLDAQVIA